MFVPDYSIVAVTWCAVVMAMTATTAYKYFHSLAAFRLMAARFGHRNNKW